MTYVVGSPFTLLILYPGNTGHFFGTFLRLILNEDFLWSLCKDRFRRITGTGALNGMLSFVLNVMLSIIYNYFQLYIAHNVHNMGALFLLINFWTAPLVVNVLIH